MAAFPQQLQQPPPQLPTMNLPPNKLPGDLPQLLKTSFSSFCATVVRPTVDVDKIMWNNKIRKNEMYYRGIQHLTYGMNQGGWGADYVALSGQSQMGIRNSGGANDPNQAYRDYVLNILMGDVDTFCAVLGGRAPNTQAQIRDLSNEQQMTLKVKADRVNAYLDSHIDMPLLHGKLCRGLSLYGTMFSHSRYRVNGRKYGITPEVQFQEQAAPMGGAEYHCYNCGAVTPAEVAHSLSGSAPGLPPNTVPCSQCGTPLGPEWLVQPQEMMTLVPNAILPLANGAVECSLYNGSQFTTLLSAPDLDNCPWGILENEEDKGALIQAYPELRKRAYDEAYVVDKATGDSMGRWTRELITSPSNRLMNTRKARWLHSLLWLSTSTYEYLPNDQSGNVRGYLYDNYPDGLKIPFVNGEPLIGDSRLAPDAPNRIVNERMTSVIAACQPKPGEMVYSNPYFDCMIQFSDLVNDCIELLVEQAQRANPMTIADPEVLDPAILSATASIPGQFYMAKPGSAGSFDRAFYKLQPAELNPMVMNFIDKSIEWVRNITGITPALFGGQSGPANQTAYEADLKHNQAMMKLGPTWTCIRSFWAKTKENCIYQAAKFSDGKLYSANQQGVVHTTELDNIWQLMAGGWYMETEEGMPMSIGQRRNFVMSTLKLDPQTRNEVFGMTDPDNITKIQETVGMSDWKVPGFDMIMKLNTVIGKLLSSQPIEQPPPPPDPTGMTPPQPPPPPQPSIPFDAFLYDPVLASKYLKSWLVSARAETYEGSPGYDNVLAFAHAAQDAMPPPPPPPKSPLSVTANISELTPPAQEAVFQEAGLNVPPGTLIAFPPLPKGGESSPHGGEGGPPPEGGPPGGPPPGLPGGPPPGGGPAGPEAPIGLNMPPPPQAPPIPGGGPVQ